MEILPDTRSFDGCEGLDVKINSDDPNNLVLVERWQSRPHYEKYFAWRQETGLIDRLGPVLGAPPSIRYLDDTGICQRSRFKRQNGSSRRAGDRPCAANAGEIKAILRKP